MSDSEFEYSEVVVSQPQQVRRKKSHAPPTLSSSAASVCGGKRATAGESSRPSKKSKKDLFAILSAEESAAPGDGTQRFETSQFVARVAQGHTRRALPNCGDFFVDCKVYKVEDVRNVPGAERYKKALASVKLQCSEGSKQWSALQDFLAQANNLFEGCESVFFNYK